MRKLCLVIALICPSMMVAAEPRDFITPDARMVIRVNVESLVSSPLAKANGNPIHALAAALTETARTFDLDGTTPIERLWIMVSETYPKGTLLVAQGKFDANRLHRQFQELARTRPQSVRLSRESEAAILSIDIPRSAQPIPGTPGAALIASAGSDLIVAAFEKETLLAALARMAATSTAKPANAPLLEKLDATAALSWAAVVPPALSDPKAALAGAGQIHGTLQLDRGFLIKCSITTSADENESQNMADRLRDGLAQTRKLLPTLSQTSIDPKLASWLTTALNATRIKAQPERVEIVIEMESSNNKSKP